MFQVKDTQLKINGQLLLKDKSNAKPFLKWVGGKRQLLSQFNALYPKELAENKIKNYYEPFLGGGAVFFDIVQRFNIENAYLYDINRELVLTYQVVQRDVSKLLTELEVFDKSYQNINDERRKAFYYSVRDDFNKQRFDFDYDSYSDSWIHRAAQILFLNKTCFNGLFRFNLKGAFNSPQGNYKNPRILDEENLLSVSEVLQTATIKRADFREMLNDMSDKHSFVYFDPPYKPISKTASFTAYSKFSFEDDEQLQLAALFQNLDARGVKLMLSNSDLKNTDTSNNFFDNLYGSFNITRVQAKRFINSNPKKRNAIDEIVVTNY